MLSVRIIVLNYNGQDLLQRYLPSVIRSAQKSARGCKISVLDNASRDGSVEMLKQKFPEAEVYANPENTCLCAYNNAASYYQEDVLIFLNSDIETDPEFVDPLVEVFEQRSDVFFAATHGDHSKPRFRSGVLSADIDYEGYQKSIEKPGLSFSAGIGAFDRKKFLELGGYDKMYLPGYYEDVDLCFRAWKRGWTGCYVPASRKFHQGGASFSKKYSRKEVQTIVHRNALLFMVKNISDPGLLTKFVLLLPLRLVLFLVSGKFFYVNAFFKAVGKFPEALSGRKSAQKNARLADREVLSYFRSL